MTDERGRNYDIIRCTVADIPDLVRLRCAQMVDIDRHDAGGEYRPVTLDEASQHVPEDVQKNIRAYLEAMLPNGQFVCWIARDSTSGEPVATAGYVVYHSPPSMHDHSGRRGQIHNVYTVGNHRRKGLGREIISRLIANAHADELSRLELRSSKEGREFYESLGFEAAPFFKLKIE